MLKNFGNSTGEIVGNILIIYLALTLILTVYSIIRMYYIEHKTNDVALGRKRLVDLHKSGRFMSIPVYSMNEMKEDKHLEDVRLIRFPNDTGEKKPFVMILPGGGYAHLCTKEEGYPVAAAFNAIGYTAFILEYRTGLKCTPFGPMEDVGQALQLIADNADKWNVNMEGYALVGFSAGGNLAAIFASNYHGYRNYGVPKPSTIMLGYPWTCVNDWLRHPYWNIWIGLLGLWLSNRGSIFMFGPHHMIKGRRSLDAQRYVEDDYPPVYMFSGSLDTLVPASRHADVFAESLDAHGISYQYDKFLGLPHGIGLGKGTKAEVWLQHALDFWKMHI